MHTLSHKKRSHPTHNVLDAEDTEITLLPCKKLKLTDTHDTITHRLDTHDVAVITLPNELIGRIYRLLSSEDNWSLFMTHSYFRDTQKEMLYTLDFFPQLKVDSCLWKHFPYLQHLTIQSTRVLPTSMDATQLPRHLQTLHLLTLPSFVFENARQLPATLSTLHLSTVSMAFTDTDFLPSQLQSLTLDCMEVDREAYFPPLPPSLTYLFVKHLKKYGFPSTIFEDVYYGLPQDLIHLHAPFPCSLKTIKRLPRSLRTLSNTENTGINNWVDKKSILALPPNLEVLSLNFSAYFKLDMHDLALLPSSLRVFNTGNIGLYSSDRNIHMLNMNLFSHLKCLTELSLHGGSLDIDHNGFQHFPSTLLHLHLNTYVARQNDLTSEVLAMLPRGLRQLSIMHPFTITSSSLNQLPSTITHLTLRCIITPLLMMDDLAHLTQLSHFEYEGHFDACSLSSLPSELSSLTLYHTFLCKDPELPCITRNLIQLLPRKLKRLMIQGFYEPAVRTTPDPDLLRHLPPSLTHLKLDALPVHVNAWKYLPPTLKHLRLNIVIVDDQLDAFMTHLPPALQTFKLSHYHDFSPSQLDLLETAVNKATLPKSLITFKHFTWDSCTQRFEHDRTYS